MTLGARHLRQVLLPEIGAAGQERIAAASAAVGGPSLAHEVATLYARGAGFAAIAAGPIDEDALAPESLCADASARAVLAGSRAALAALRATLGVDP